MANSFSFNSVDMSSYGLRLLTHEEPFSQETPAAQLADRSYGFDSLRSPIPVSLDVKVYAADIATLKSYLDSIKQTLNQRTDCPLAIDTFDDRYWMVRFVSMVGEIHTARVWKGTITFSANDPAAYDNDETDHDHTVDEDPEEFTETAGGTDQAFPVYTLTCDDTLTDTTVVLTNTATGEALTWEGSLVADDELEIDSDNHTVKLNGAEDMLYVDGRFPRLLPGGNAFTLSGFSGNLNITYRPRYV